MVVAALHVISHTRKEEELGLTELVRSFQVGRQANALATPIEVLVINVILMVFIAGVLISFGSDSITVERSFLFAASIVAPGLIGAGIALMSAQIMQTSSAASAIALGVTGVLYILRASTDASTADLSLLHSIGCTYSTYPFTEKRWSPVIYALLFSLLMVIM